MTPQQQRDLEAWLDHSTSQTSEADARALASVALAYSAITDWNDPGQTIPAATQAQASAMNAVRFVTGLASEYIATTLHIMTGQRPRPAANTIVYPRVGVTPWQVYSRPIHTARASLKSADDQQAATKAAADRLGIIIATDTLLARRAAMTSTMDVAPEVTGYRRIIRPYLSTGGTCGLCIAAATMRYKRGSLLPIHSRCKCTILPILGETDPGLKINQDDLKKAYAASSADGKDLTRTRFTITDDNELGPTLDTPTTSNSRQHFDTGQKPPSRGPDALPRGDDGPLLPFDSRKIRPQTVPTTQFEGFTRDELSLAPDEDPDLFFRLARANSKRERKPEDVEKEVSVARWLRRRGCTVLSVEESLNNRPEAWVRVSGGHEFEVEFKCLETPTISAVESRMRQARTQARYVVLDMRGLPITADESVALIDAVMPRRGGYFIEILALVDGGEDGIGVLW